VVSSEVIAEEPEPQPMQDESAEVKEETKDN